MRQIALPVLKRLGMVDFCTEGDNLIMTFRDLASATQAAYELQQRPTTPAYLQAGSISRSK